MAMETGALPTDGNRQGRSEHMGKGNQMLLYTVQPRERKTGDTSVADNLGLTSHLGYQPVFCTPVNPDSLEEFWFRAWSAAPRHPEEICLIDAPDDLPVPMDVLAWTNLMARNGLRDVPSSFDGWDAILRRGDPLATDWLLRPDDLDGGRIHVTRIPIRAMALDTSWLSSWDGDTRGLEHKVALLYDECVNVAGDPDVTGKPTLTYELLYGVISMSSLVAVIWTLMTGRGLLDPAFDITTRILVNGSLAFDSAQRHLQDWDNDIAYGVETGMPRIRRMHDEFVAGLTKAAQRVVNEMARRDGVRRNDPCPCGSGRKLKQCHGRISSIDDLIVP